MKKLLHLSDLHFGRVDDLLVEPLLVAAKAVAPDLIVISGDFTQRARRAEYRAARAFLERLSGPRLVVPGNHDIPLWDVVRRFVSPLGRYRHYIAEDLSPFYADDEMAVLGINTARSLTRKYGRINAQQVARAREVLARIDPALVKVVVTHHPFDLPPGSRSHSIVGRSAMAMEGLAAAGVDLILSGHLHLQHIGLTTTRYPIKGHSALLVQAGTTISTRGRGEANSFNVIRIEKPAITIEHHLWRAEGGDFQRTIRERFERRGGLWERSELPTEDSLSAGEGGGP
ncbi:MAG TPA: metallophosphoesterase [Chthoniobacterales bacterium]|nr:metallophosphoesterase [Chthoniobacterales bacterium]